MSLVLCLHGDPCPRGGQSVGQNSRGLGPTFGNQFMAPPPQHSRLPGPDPACPQNPGPPKSSPIAGYTKTLPTLLVEPQSSWRHINYNNYKQSMFTLHLSSVSVFVLVALSTPKILVFLLTTPVLCRMLCPFPQHTRLSHGLGCHVQLAEPIPLFLHRSRVIVRGYN